jgi:hypothetical protein
VPAAELIALIMWQHDDSAALCIWLHALTNAGAGWSFSAPLPAWALDLAPAAKLAAAIPGYPAPDAENPPPDKDAAGMVCHDESMCVAGGGNKPS